MSAARSVSPAPSNTSVTTVDSQAWHLADWRTSSGVFITRDQERALENEHECGRCVPFEQADHPTYIASTFERAVKLLPLCPMFKNCFVRVNGVYRRTGTIFWAVEGVQEVFQSAEYAKAAFDFQGKPWAGIYASSSKQWITEVLEADAFIMADDASDASGSKVDAFTATQG